MPTVLQFRRGTTGQNNSFTGTAGELSIDTTLDTVRVHDGSTAGGFELTSNSATQTLTNKTLTSAILNTGVSGTAVLDEDTMASNSATQLATQQSIKAYVDSQVTAVDVDIAGDTGTGAITDAETLTFTGGTGIDTTVSGNEVSFAIDSSVTTLTGTQTLTNKTLTSPTITGTGEIAGTFTGNITGDVTGNADTATTLETARNIAGQSFDGSANITIASTDLSNTSDVVLLTSTQTLTNKTLTSPKVNEDVVVTATATELNYVDGVTSAIQTQLDTKATTGKAIAMALVFG